LLRRSLVLVATLAVALIAVAGAQPRTQADPARIISLSPTLTEDLFAVGAGKQVIAVDDQSDYPKSAPRTKLSGFTPNAEAVAAYNPDLVFVSYDGPFVGQLQKLGIKVAVLEAANTIAEAYEQIRQVGRLTGHTAQATKVVRGMQKKLTTLIRSVPKSNRHLRVFHEISPDYYSATSATFIGKVYKLFGFTNIADAADSAHTGYPQLSGEYVLSANPQIVVLADSVCCGTTAANASARAGWSNLAAVKQKRVIAVDDSIASRWGPRIVDFARIIANVARKSG
jgi:iron complex transport system substrate-binding protein